MHQGYPGFPLGVSEDLKPEEVRVLGYPRAELKLGIIPAVGIALGVRRLPSGVPTYSSTPRRTTRATAEAL